MGQDFEEICGTDTFLSSDIDMLLKIQFLIKYQAKEFSLVNKWNKRTIQSQGRIQVQFPLVAEVDTDSLGWWKPEPIIISPLLHAIEAEL